MPIQRDNTETSMTPLTSNPSTSSLRMSMQNLAEKMNSMPSFPETQARMPQYTLAEEVYDVMDVIVELGYVLFFGFVAPEVISLFLISNMLRLHALGWKLVYTMQRPFPDMASGLGVVFERVFRVMSRCAVACNIVLILLTNSEENANHDAFQWLKELISRPATGDARDRDWKSMLAVFFVVDGVISVLRYVVDVVIPDIPAKVVLDQKRSEAIHRQLASRATSELKMWEGRELERAYDEASMDSKRPQALHSGADGCHEWGPTMPEVMGAVDGVQTQGPPIEVLPWKSTDPLFEEAWFLQGPPDNAAEG